jgi:hypothetical protein
MKTAYTIVIVGMLALLTLGCAQQQIAGYDEGIAQLSNIQAKYGADFQNAPVKEAIPSLVAELEAFRHKMVENEDTRPLFHLIEYRTHALESDRLLMEGFKWGDASTTEPGFGCRKGSERILNSSALRGMGAAEGMKAIEPLQQFVEEYPDKAAALNLSQRTVLSLSTTYAVVQQQAEKDTKRVESFCKDAIIITQLEDGLYHVVAVDAGETQEPEEK